MQILMKYGLLFTCFLVLMRALTSHATAGQDGVVQISTPNGTTIQAEIADTTEKRAKGLMYRDSLAKDRGMLFTFAEPQLWTFWMKNTRIPLDIMYVRSDGTVVSIRQMRAYDLTAVPSAAPAKYAIELNNGVASTTGIHEGDKVQIPPDASNPAE